jgi:hypothetical protein
MMAQSCAPTWTEQLPMNGKKAFLAVVVVFLGFWMFTDPGGLADAAKAGASQTWSIAEDLFNAVIRFFGALV